MVKRIVLLILAICLMAWCSYDYTMRPSTYGFGLCQASAALVGCWTMIVVEDIKKRLKDGERREEDKQ